MKSLSLKMIGLAICAVAVAAFAAGCGSSSSAAPDPASSVAETAQTAETGSAPVSTIDAKLTEYAIKTNSSVAKAGKVTFKVTNDGDMPHEMVVLKTDTPAGSLKVTNGRVSEKDSVGEVSDIPTGKSRSNTLDLKPGKYVLVCNIAGHYEQGMYAPLIVK